eukprot:12928435-Prorocentrum_lima.AAC.1
MGGPEEALPLPFPCPPLAGIERSTLPLPARGPERDASPALGGEDITRIVRSRVTPNEAL